MGSFLQTRTGCCVVGHKYWRMELPLAIDFSLALSGCFQYLSLSTLQATPRHSSRGDVPTIATGRERFLSAAPPNPGLGFVLRESRQLCTQTANLATKNAAAVSDGDNRGATWLVIFRFRDTVNRIRILHSSSRVIEQKH